MDSGALRVGVATKKTLQGGPPSIDITYPLPSAESAICFALPLNKEKIRSFLKKEMPNGRVDHEIDNIETNVRAFLLAKETSKLLQNKGYDAVEVFPNFKYREEIPGWELRMFPEIALRYIAVRSGVGSFGWSGNVGMKGQGCAIILGCLVTSAILAPTEPMPEEESFCSKCKLCTKVCAMRMFDTKETESISLGDSTFTYAKRRNIGRCQIVCGGLSGLDKSKKWSTWSPGRYPYPETDKDVTRLFSLCVTNASKWPKNPDEPGGIDMSKLEQNLELSSVMIGDKSALEMIRDTKLTCGNCQLICFGDSEETSKNYELLVNSGCVIQKEDGTIIVLPSEEAEKEFNQMDRKHRKLYFKELKNS